MFLLSGRSPGSSWPATQRQGVLIKDIVQSSSVQRELVEQSVSIVGLYSEQTYKVSAAPTSARLRPTHFRKENLLILLSVPRRPPNSLLSVFRVISGSTLAPLNERWRGIKHKFGFQTCYMSSRNKSHSRRKKGNCYSCGEGCFSSRF